METTTTKKKPNGNGTALFGSVTSIVTADVEIRGVTSILQHRFGENEEAAPGTRRVLVDRGTPREEAERYCYRAPDGTLYFPGAAISRLLREAGGGHKQRGSRKSLKYIIPAAVVVLDDTVSLLHPQTRSPLTDFEVDSRPVVIPATKGRIMRHRPRLDEWMAKFRLRINTQVLPVTTVQQLLVEGGMQVGIGDYRPERGGPFGTFSIVSWDDR